MSRGKSGYIYKEGAKVLNWKKRFLVIEKDRGLLSYYEREDKKKKKGEIIIKTIKAVKRYDSPYKGKKFCFGIVTSTGRTYYIQCSDDNGVDSWMCAIREVSGLDTESEDKTSFQTKDFGSPRNISNGGLSNSLPSGSVSPRGTPEKSTPKKMGPEDFQTLRLIGRGGFGRVLLVRKLDTKQVYAMKVLKKSVIAARGEIDHTRTEQQVLARVDCPFLAKLHWSFQTDEFLYFIMDFINGGELFFHLSNERCFKEDRAKFYSAQIITGIQYLHNMGIIYRDLKPENILLNSLGNIVMTDFGLSKQGLVSNESRTTTFCGTPEYLAPEIIRGEEYTKAIDWWSVGTLIFEMLTGLPPFYSDQEENMYHKILVGALELPSHFSPEVGDLISKLLIKDVRDRLQDPIQIKAHPWFANIDWYKLEHLQITPTFIPKVKSPEDVTNIDEEFLNEDPNKVDDGEDGYQPASKEAFQNFTFAIDHTKV